MPILPQLDWDDTQPIWRVLFNPETLATYVVKSPSNPFAFEGWIYTKAMTKIEAEIEASNMVDKERKKAAPANTPPVNE